MVAWSIAAVAGILAASPATTPADPAATARAALDTCIAAQASRFDPLESRILDAANLVVTIGCQAETRAYLAAKSLPSTPAATMAAMGNTGDKPGQFPPSAFSDSIVVSQELLEQAAKAVIDARERRLGLKK